SGGRVGIATLIAAGRLDDRLVERALGLLRELDPKAEFMDWIDEGDAVDLRFEMNTLVVLCAAPHPLDPTPVYDPAGVRLTASRADPVAADDLCRTSCPQNGRGFVNTERFYAV
ncbi:MAG TPA: hypothetical protein VGP22_03520, partial [Albitalea sp.]|nr:hypothetical protein [Albitalea sp.]